MPLLLCSMFRASAQDEQFSQYMAGVVLFNPAAAGFGSGLEQCLLVRNQWVGLPGHPSRQ